MKKIRRNDEREKQKMTSGRQFRPLVIVMKICASVTVTVYHGYCRDNAAEQAFRLAI